MEYDKPCCFGNCPKGPGKELFSLALPQEYLYTYADLLEWEGDGRYELYDGRPRAMSSPSDIHQEISMALSAQLYNYLKGKQCKPYAAPFDVRLFAQQGDRPEDTDTVVQPDLMVVCDPEKVDRHGVRGAPDLVIEILSESTRQLDRLVKFSLYQRAGVREYWIVDPANRSVAVHTLEEGAYHGAAAYPFDAVVPVGVLEGCQIDLSAVFPERQKP